MTQVCLRSAVLWRYVPTLCLMVMAGITANAEDDGPFQRTLTDTAPGATQANWTGISSEITPDCPHAWWVRKSTLHGGRQEGVELVTIHNGRMTIVVCPTRGMGILSVTMGDVALKWDSPVTEVVNPHYVDLGSRGGLGWLEGFNEFLCRCGLESNGHPGTDQFVNNVGETAEMELTLHGRIANLPSRQVRLSVDRTAPYAIHLQGRTDEKLLFGPKLELHSELVVIPGDHSFQINDDVRNVGAQDQEFQMLYHANFGRPLLEEGAQVVVAARTVTPFNDRAAEGLDHWNTYDGPTTGFVEQVYLLEPKGDSENHTTALLHNRAGNKAASISWSLNELPYLTVWKNTGALADGYVTGIEPGTNYPNNRRVEREAGRVPVLAPGGTHRMNLTFSLYSGAADVQAAVAAVHRIGLAGEGVDDPNAPIDQQQRQRPRP